MELRAHLEFEGRRRGSRPYGARQQHQHPTDDKVVIRLNLLVRERSGDRNTQRAPRCAN